MNEARPGYSCVRLVNKQLFYWMSVFNALRRGPSEYGVAVKKKLALGAVTSRALIAHSPIRLPAFLFAEAQASGIMRYEKMKLYFYFKDTPDIII